MTLLSVVKDVCATVGVVIPQSVFSSIAVNRTEQEMLSLANEMAQRIGWDTRDWTQQLLEYSLAGDGTTEYFPLPANFKRLILTSNVWRASTPLTPMRFIANADEWLQRRLYNINDARGEWMMLGNTMRIFPLLKTGDTVRFIYLDRNIVNIHGGGGESDTFLNDDDTFFLDERLLKLGMIWQWKAQKGSPYQEDMGTYEDALAMAAGADQPAPIIIGRTPISASARAGVAYPWPVPT